MIPSRLIFDDHAGDYDRWFDEHGAVYEAQVRMLQNAVPRTGRGLEVGIGSGRFAVPLGIVYGIDPSRELLKMAKSRGIEVMIGEGEHLPYRADSFDYVLMMTVICFVDDMGALFHEADRVLVPGGILITGFIERGGEIEKIYRNEKTKGRFLRYARFWTEDEVTRLLEEAGFTRVKVAQRSRGFCVINGISKRSL
jgi:SAM-dependent methyltransferase